MVEEKGGNNVENILFIHTNDGHDRLVLYKNTGMYNKTYNKIKSHSMIYLLPFKEVRGFGILNYPIFRCLRQQSTSFYNCRLNK